GQGTSVKGRVVLSGPSPKAIDLHQSLNWLVLRAPGVEPPPELRSAGFRARDGWNDGLTSTAEGLAFLETLHHAFVTLDQDGRFQVGRVAPGDYDLAFRLYEPPEEGCLVNPVGSRVVRFRVPQDRRNATLDLGDIEVKVAPGPRPGEVVPDLAFTSFSG